VNLRNVLSDSDLPVWPDLVSPAADVFKVNSALISFGREMLHKLSHCFCRPFKNLLDSFDNITSPFPVRQVRLYHLVFMFPRTRVCLLQSLTLVGPFAFFP